MKCPATKITAAASTPAAVFVSENLPTAERTACLMFREVLRRGDTRFKGALALGFAGGDGDGAARDLQRRRLRDRDHAARAPLRATEARPWRDPLARPPTPVALVCELRRQ